MACAAIAIFRYENKVNKNIMLWEIVKNVGKYVYENIFKTI